MSVLCLYFLLLIYLIVLPAKPIISKSMKVLILISRTNLLPTINDVIISGRTKYNTRFKFILPDKAYFTVKLKFDFYFKLFL